MRYLPRAGALRGVLWGATLVIGAGMACAQELSLGDLDEDGGVAVRDRALLNDHISGTPSRPANPGPFDATHAVLADVKKEGAVNSGDRDELIKEIQHSRSRETLPLETVRITSPAGGRVLLTLKHPEIKHTCNRTERGLRGAVIARGVSHCSKNEQVASVYKAMNSVTAAVAVRGNAVASALADQSSRAGPFRRLWPANQLHFCELVIRAKKLSLLTTIVPMENLPHIKVTITLLIQERIQNRLALPFQIQGLPRLTLMT